MTEARPDHAQLLAQLQPIVQGLAETFAPFCEVVLHDLTRPGQAILAIQNNLSGREVGQPATELGLARIADPTYPQVIANYANQFADGRPVKSTSIGIKDAEGQYVAALCLNIDLTVFQSLQHIISQFAQVNTASSVQESLNPTGTLQLQTIIQAFAAKRATVPGALTTEDRRKLLNELEADGYLDRRRAMETVATQLGVSRATAYTYKGPGRRASSVSETIALDGGAGRIASTDLKPSRSTD